MRIEGNAKKILKLKMGWCIMRSHWEGHHQIIRQESGDYAWDMRMKRGEYCNVVMSHKLVSYWSMKLIYHLCMWFMWMTVCCLYMYLMQEDISGETKPLKRFVPDFTGDGICINKSMTISDHVKDVKETMMYFISLIQHSIPFQSQEKFGNRCNTLSLGTVNFFYFADWNWYCYNAYQQ